MRRFVMITGVILAIYAAASAQESKQPNREKTEHLIIEWNDEALGEEGLAMAKEKGEAFYAAIRDMVGHEPKQRVIVMLLGHAQQPNGRWKSPRVDGFGRIELYRYDNDHHSYFSALAHELVHVFRFRRSTSMDWFLEEGFAEFVALRVDPSLRGFPWFDFPVAVAAGQWFTDDENIPLADLRNEHRRYNMPCRAQSYTLRSAFFDYLGKKYGDDKVIKLASLDDAGALEHYKEVFGKDFDALAAEWREALLSEYNGIENVAAIAKKYRKESPIQYQPVCD